MSELGPPPIARCVLSPRTCPAFILAGGRSSRFGSDKALVEVDGQPLLLKLRSALLRNAHQVSIVANRADRYRDLGVVCLLDHTDNCGPLAGVATALQQRLKLGPGWALIVSCDQLVWRDEWFEELARRANVDHAAQQYGAAYFMSRDAAGALRPEPLPCLLHTRQLPKVLERLRCRQLSLRGLLDHMSAGQVTLQSGPKQWSFNTPQELRNLSGSAR